MTDLSGEGIPDQTDVVVVGGGIMGTATAFFLARDGEPDVTLLERDRLAAGSTGDSSAILRHHYGDEAIYTDMAWWSHEFYRSFEAETGAPLTHADAPLVRFATEGTQGGRYASAGYEVLADRDIPVSRDDAATLRSQYPMYEGTTEYDFAVSDDAAGYSDGSDAAQGFARGATSHGASVHTGVTVESIETDGESVAAVETAVGTVRCDTVVVAAGPWTPGLAATVGVDIPITPVREQILLLDPPAAYAESYPDLTPTTSLPGGRWYVRPDVGGGILVATHRHDDPADPDDYENAPDEETVLELVDALAEHVPELADAGIKGSYCGIYSTTPDHDFVIDEAGPDGCVWLSGFSGHGFKHGPAVGTLASALVRDEPPVLGETEIDMSYFSLDRFADDPAGNGRPDDFI